jgi:hypothetical protein
MPSTFTVAIDLLAPVTSLLLPVKAEHMALALGWARVVKFRSIVKHSSPVQIRPVVDRITGAIK